MIFILVEGIQMLGIVVYAAAGPEPIALMMVVPGEIGHSGRCAHDGIHWLGCSDVVGDVMHFTFFRTIRGRFFRFRCVRCLLVVFWHLGTTTTHHTSNRPDGHLCRTDLHLIHQRLAADVQRVQMYCRNLVG